MKLFLGIIVSLSLISCAKLGAPNAGAVTATPQFLGAGALDLEIRSGGSQNQVRAIRNLNTEIANLTDKLDARCADINLQITAYRESQANFSAELASLNVQLDSLNQERVSQQNALDALNTQSQTLTSERTTVQSMIASARGDYVRGIRSSITTVKQALRTLRNDLKPLLRRDINSFGSVDELIAYFQQLSDLRARIAGKERELADLNRALQSPPPNNAVAEQRISAITSQLGPLSTSISQVRNNLSTIVASLNSIQARVAVLTRSNDPSAQLMITPAICGQMGS